MGPLPIACAQAACHGAQRLNRRSDGHNASRRHGASSLPEMLRLWKSEKSTGENEASRLDGFAVRCYLFQMLTSYSEFLRYSPGHVQTSFFLRSDRLTLRT